MQNARDNIVKATHIDTRTVRCGLIVGTASFHEIAVDAIKKASSRPVCGLRTIAAWIVYLIEREI